MSKKLIIAILASLVAFSVVGCTENKVVQTSNEQVINETEQIGKAKIRAIDEFEFEGEWAKDFSRSEVMMLHDHLLQRVEQLSIELGLTEEYVVEEQVREEEGLSINDNYIYLDIDEPEDNRLESMYYGFKQYGNDLSVGEISLKLGFNLGENEIKENGEFKFEDTAMYEYSTAFTGLEDRDFSELNEQVYDMIINKREETIVNNLDGLKESISYAEDYLLYKIETKRYEFK